MLGFTVCLTLCIETVMLSFVFYGVHFYVGAGLCILIIYILLSLGFSNPGLAHEELEVMQLHRDLGECNSHCRHTGSIQEVPISSVSNSRIIARSAEYPVTGVPTTAQCAMCVSVDTTIIAFSSASVWAPII